MGLSGSGSARSSPAIKFAGFPEFKRPEHARHGARLGPALVRRDAHASPPQPRAPEKRPAAERDKAGVWQGKKEVIECLRQRKKKKKLYLR